jgi:uncharacterized membrane protein YoaK (UPF0700 family)
VFAAHITGNLVVLAAHVVTGRAASLAPIVSLPMFIVVLGLTRRAVAGLEETRHGPLQPLQLVPLVIFLTVWVAAGSRLRHRRPTAHLPLLTEDMGVSLGYRGQKDEQTFRSGAGHVGYVAVENPRA